MFPSRATTTEPARVWLAESRTQAARIDLSLLTFDVVLSLSREAAARPSPVPRSRRLLRRHPLVPSVASPHDKELSRSWGVFDENENSPSRCKAVVCFDKRIRGKQELVGEVYQEFQGFTRS